MKIPIHMTLTFFGCSLRGWIWLLRQKRQPKISSNFEGHQRTVQALTTELGWRKQLDQAFEKGKIENAKRKTKEDLSKPALNLSSSGKDSSAPTADLSSTAATTTSTAPTVSCRTVASIHRGRIPEDPTDSNRPSGTIFPQALHGLYCFAGWSGNWPQTVEKGKRVARRLGSGGKERENGCMPFFRRQLPEQHPTRKCSNCRL